MPEKKNICEWTQAASAPERPENSLSVLRRVAEQGQRRSARFQRPRVSPEADLRESRLQEGVLHDRACRVISGSASV